MKNNLDLMASWGGSVLAGIGTWLANVDWEALMQGFSLAISICAGVFSIAYTLYKMIKRILADRKITKEEAEEIKGAVGAIVSGLDSIQEKDE